MRTSKGALARAQKRVASQGQKITRHWEQLGHWQFPDVLDEDGEVDLDATIVAFAHIYNDCRVIGYEWAGRADLRWAVDSRRRPLCPACEAADNQIASSRFMADVMMVGRTRFAEREAANALPTSERDDMGMSEVLDVRG
jgi:hypothetical protein